MSSNTTGPAIEPAAADPAQDLASDGRSTEDSGDEFQDDGVSELGGVSGPISPFPADTDYLQSVASSSTSLASSIRDFRVENGRTYHRYKEGKYHFPNDEIENDRLDLQHNLCLLTFDNKLGLAPPNEPDSKVKRVLDVGTGTGIWAIDFAEDHPDAEVIGFDLSPTMPDFVPPNVKFEIDDLEEDWTWSQPFDYIHSRMMTASVADWKTYAKKVFDNLAPGGYFELQEGDLFLQSDDNTLKPDSALSKCMEYMYKASVILGRPYQDIPALVKVLEETGFVDVKLNSFKWPTNPWPKDPKYRELGLWNHENLYSGLEAFTMAPFTRAHGWTKEEVHVFLIDVRKDVKDRSIHAYWPFYAIHARKPTEELAAKTQ